LKSTIAWFAGLDNHDKSFAQLGGSYFLYWETKKRDLPVLVPRPHVALFFLDTVVFFFFRNRPRHDWCVEEQISPEDGQVCWRGCHAHDALFSSGTINRNNEAKRTTSLAHEKQKISGYLAQSGRGMKCRGFTSWSWHFGSFSNAWSFS